MKMDLHLETGQAKLVFIEHIFRHRKEKACEFNL